MVTERERQLTRLQEEIRRLRAGAPRRSPQEVRKAVEAALTEALRRLEEIESKDPARRTRPQKETMEPESTTEETDGAEPE